MRTQKQYSYDENSLYSRLSKTRTVCCECNQYILLAESQKDLNKPCSEEEINRVLTKYGLKNPFDEKSAEVKSKELIFKTSMLYKKYKDKINFSTVYNYFTQMNYNCHSASPATFLHNLTRKEIEFIGELLTIIREYTSSKFIYIP